MKKVMKEAKAGFSLVEIMLAALILALLALGGSAVLYHTEAGIQDQEIKRMAVDQAMERMELLKRTRYTIMQPSTYSNTYYFVDSDGDDMLENSELSTDPDKKTETSKQFDMVTTLVKMSPANPNTESEYIMVSVTVKYGRAKQDNQQMVMESIVVPDL